MIDTVSKKKRSDMMSRISSKNTVPELIIRGLLHQAGYRFRIHRKDLPGKPDLVMPKYNLIIFIHGCFWHRHSGCKYAYQPKSQIEFWQKKFNSNVIRDQKNIFALHNAGWRVAVIWECLIKNKKPYELLETLQQAIHGTGLYYQWPS